MTYLIRLASYGFSKAAASVRVDVFARPTHKGWENKKLFSANLAQARDPGLIGTAEARSSDAKQRKKKTKQKWLCPKTQNQNSRLRTCY